MGLSMDESVEIELNIDDSASHCGSDERKNVSRKRKMAQIQAVKSSNAVSDVCL